MRKKYSIGFIGFGHMGAAIAQGAAKSDYLERREIAVYDHNIERAKKICKSEHFDFLENEKEIVENCNVVVLAVTPQQIDGALDALIGTKIDCLLSVVTGVSIAYLQERLGENTPIIRSMPNTPLLIGYGATALCRSANTSADDYDFVFKMFSSIGKTRTVPEEKMAEFVTVNGSTPAYFYYFVQCLIEDAVSRGIDEDTAKTLIIQTMVGAGNMLLNEPNKDIQEFIDAVCSKGGTTIEAITELQNSNLKEILHQASNKCANRAIEIGK